VGVFLCIHLSVNASIMAGADAFQFAVDQLHKLDKLGILKAVEVLFIFVPIAFHAVLGIIIWLSGSQNLLQYRYCGNLRYTLQRWTGIIAIVFIVLHLWHVHWIIPGGIEFDAHAAAASTVGAMQVWWSAPLYAIGVLCAVFHLANGVWTFLITWGVTIGPRSQTLSAWVCGLIGVVLGLFGIGALIKLETMDIPPSEPATAQSTHAASLDVVTDLES
jgi:succinate dehydrogenase / fumarate reductase cytochrome b subunit